MGSYDNYRNTDYLDDVSFIAGSEFVLKFPVSNELGAPLNISTSTMDWGLALYGQPEVSILHKAATRYDSTTFQVELEEADTLTLGDDVYLQQMRITYSYVEDGNTITKHLRPAQGLVIIRKAVAVE